MTSPAEPRSPLPVPPLLRDLAAWTWRLLVLALAGYLLVRFLDIFYFLVLPAIGALLAVALAHPVVAFLRRHRVPRVLATLITVIAAILIIGGVGTFVVVRASDQYPQLVDQLNTAVDKAQSFLTAHLHVKKTSFSSISTTVTNYLNQHKSSIASTALTGIATIGEAAAALVLWIFISIVLIHDGEGVWSWFVGLFPSTAQGRVRGAGAEAWARLAGFVRGTFLIALFHGVVIAIALSAMGVPLVAPLAVLVFFGSFLPIIGSFVFGGLAVLVTLVVKGPVLGVVLIGVLVFDNQVESHVLQPFLVGRYVQLHPLAIAFAIAGGSVVEGLYGAVLAVPVVAVVYAVMKYLALGRTEGELDEEPATVEADEAEPADTLSPG